MNTFPNEVIDIVGIGASTLDRFIVVDHFPTGARCNRPSRQL